MLWKVGGVEGQIFSNQTIIPAIPRFEKQPSGLPFAYSREGVLFIICSKIATVMYAFTHT